MGNRAGAGVNYILRPSSSANRIRTERAISTPDDGTSRPSRLGDLDLEAHLRDARIKQRFVTPMFDIIAPRYDRFTRVFSFGMDRGWKAELIEAIAPAVTSGSRVLDLACGTGDLALALASRVSDGEVIGIDASPRMIALARERAASNAGGRPVRFAVGDMSHLDLADASVDVVTAGYALRNVPNHERALAEIARVLRPGGLLATLDFYRPESRLWRRLFLAYLSAAGNWVGWLWHREPVVYGYIAQSIAHFVSWRAFSASLSGHGLAVESVHRKLLGGVALHVARKAS